ncbi:MAG TPA: ISL3 family transposase, partial [Prosthecobacter sp.]|nr:ISL3 family transposase [Prosthecobacter sp.]
MDDWKTLFFDPRDGITVTACEWTATAVDLILVATNPTAICPRCAGRATRIRGRYWRTVRDLPWGPLAVTARLHARKFACSTPTCPRKIFTERFPALVAPSARRTRRLTDRCRALALATNAQTTIQLAATFGLSISGPTILRLVRQTPVPIVDAPRVIGVDDWAFRKRKTYGTIIVDLDRHQVLDLLPDRTAETLAVWLAGHPSIAIVTRDRSETYAAGITAGAPQAIQIADRWHLLRNWAELLERIGNRHRSLIQQCPDPHPPRLLPAPASPPAPRRTYRRHLEEQRAQTRAHKEALYAQIHALHHQGFGI